MSALEAMVAVGLGIAVYIFLRPLIGVYILGVGIFAFLSR